MFDLNDKTLTRVKRHDPFGGAASSKEAKEVATKADKLDSDRMVRRHGMLMSYYRQELDRQAENRYQMAVDEDFFDNIQWSEEDAAALKQRGQAPIVYNVISPAVRWVLGSEKRNRIDFRVLPRSKEDGQPAEKKTAILKYLSDVNRTPFHRSRAFKDAVVAGVGWLEDAVQDDDDGEPIYSRYESWRNILWDSASIEPDLRDARYLFRVKSLDVDVACALFPERAAVVESSAMDELRLGPDIGDSDEAMDSMEFDRAGYGISSTIITHKRRRVRCIEAWYRMPVRTKRFANGPYVGEEFDERNEEHAALVANGAAGVITKLKMQVRVAVMTSAGLLYDGPTPYRHERFPFTAVWGYRRGRDGMPYGIIRGLRDIQEDINKRASKALYILSTNKTVMDEGAVEDLDEFREEVARPDAVIVKKAGKELKLNVDRELAPAHLDFMSRSVQLIQSVSGVTDELMGRRTNAISGAAITARQEQGSLATADLFDNLWMAVQMQGEIQLSLIEQFYDEEKTFRITNQRGNAEWVHVNDGAPENDITRTKADFVISKMDFQASIREAQVQMLIDMIAKLAPANPQIAMITLDLVVEAMDIPNRDEIVKRIRQATGLRDPEADEPTEEEIAAMQQAQQQAAMQQAMFEAELMGKQADAQKKAADAAYTRARMINTNVGSTKAAMEAGVVALTAPPAVPVADGILQESGWPDGLTRREQQEAQQQQMQQEAAALAEQEQTMQPTQPM